MITSFEADNIYLYKELMEKIKKYNVRWNEEIEEELKRA